jgi:acyl-CoA thioester hydrolase
MTGFTVRIYYEDTDTELLRELGFAQRQLAEETGLAFAVRSLAVEYLKPAKLDDLIEVVTTIEDLGRAQVTFAQSIRRAEETLITATVRVACLDLVKGKATAMPKPIYERLKELL